MKRFILAALCGTAVVSAAHAADPARMATKAPAAAPAPSWTGFYVGGNGGYGWGSATVSGSINSKPKPSGGTGGVQVGYNYQINDIVLGVEGDFQGSDFRDTRHNTAGQPTELDAHASWFATARGRVGMAFGQFLPYVTGGVAFTQAKFNIVQTDVPLALLTSKETLTGYAVGAGLEYALSPNWSVKGEYMHLGFGGASFNASILTEAGYVTRQDFFNAKADFDTARVGINYRFN